MKHDRKRMKEKKNSRQSIPYSEKDIFFDAGLSLKLCARMHQNPLTIFPRFFEIVSFYVYWDIIIYVQYVL